MPDGFVEVSGYSETDLQNSYNSGLATGQASAVEGTTATQQQVLSGATFSSGVAGYKKSGLMPNQGTKTYTINPGGRQTIPAGYHNGNGYVQANPNQNSGTYSVTFTGDSIRDLGANNSIRYLNVSSITDTVYNIGYHDGQSAGGSAAQKGTAQPEHVLSGYTFTNTSGLHSGTIATRSYSGYYAIDPGGQVSFPSGYYPNQHGARANAAPTPVLGVSYTPNVASGSHTFTGQQTQTYTVMSPTTVNQAKIFELLVLCPTGQVTPVISGGSSGVSIFDTIDLYDTSKAYAAMKSVYVPKGGTTPTFQIQASGACTALYKISSHNVSVS